VLNGVYLDVKEPSGHYVVSTNGRILFSANSFSFDLKDSLILPNRKFLDWKGWWSEGTAQLSIKAPQKQKKGKIETELPGWLQFTTGPWTYVTRQIDGLYPNWKQVIPKETPALIIQIAKDENRFCSGGHRRDSRSGVFQFSHPP